MVDFLKISTRSTKKGIEVYPKFLIVKSSDLMIRGGDFYAIWIEERGLWSTDEDDVIELVDCELREYVKQHRDYLGENVTVHYMRDADSGIIDKWHKYCQKQLRDNYHPLDETLIFSNTKTSKKDYASKKLNYPLEAGDIHAYDELMSVLYSEEERRKLEWAIGAIVSGDSKHIQKFLVLYGSAGTGKSTVLNIIQQLFCGYYSVFDAKALGSSSNAFALEAFKTNPLVAIQHDGDLSRIEDNTRINSVVSHELMTINEKFKATYTSKFNAFLFMGTNKPVKITDAKSGIIRRLIDVSPTGNKIPVKKYRNIMKQVEFELGAIAQHCLDVYLSNPGLYDSYIPLNMLGASNDFYNFILEAYPIFKNENGTTLKAAWEMYKTYNEEARVAYPMAQRAFKEELKNYFEDMVERYMLDDGTRVRNYYIGFKTDKFKKTDIQEDEGSTINFIEFGNNQSIFNKVYKDSYAQYANEDGAPIVKWDNVSTKLSDLDTSKLHYVNIDNDKHIVVDFDIRGEDGEKNFKRNLEEASKFPPTYAEVSKSGKGIHLHYIYNGDVSELSRVYDEHIEIKVFTGKSSLRRKLTLCNNLPISTISSGLPMKGEKKVVNFDAIQSEKGLRALIKRNLNKEIHPGTKPSVDFIHKILNDTYDSGMHYDVTDMRPAILSFAASSTNQATYCIKLVNNMKFKSATQSENVINDDSELIFYDIEVFPNLFLVNWKAAGPDKKVVRMINPSSAEVEELMKHRLVGFNCRRYDNHILYGRLMGYNNEQIYNLSQRIINGSKNAFFGEAYNVSYTDVYDFCSKKQSLKKWEIELGIHHQELGLPWDQPVPEEMWFKVAEYCDNDVIATEAVFNARQADWIARQVLADLAGSNVNDTTNSLSTKIIFGKNRNPQDAFNYRNMGELPPLHERYVFDEPGLYHNEFEDRYNVFDFKKRPYFPGYKYENGVSTYRGEEIGEGGYVYSEPGMYTNIALLDIASMHPSSIIAEELFGSEYTQRFKDIVNARLAIKHKDFEAARKMLGGALAKYLTDEDSAADLAQALKIVINSVYGLTSARFDNAFRDKRNVDNIVAKRGALFMVNLKHEVQKRGFTVAHIKTDSIKIPDATPEIIKFVMDYGREYGYTFEHEATYDRMCLVNDAVYIARYKNEDGTPGKWTATGTQFAVPYVFKTLFSREDIVFEDMCEVKSVTSALYLDRNETLPNVTEWEMLKEIRQKPYENLTRKEKLLYEQHENVTEEELDDCIAEGHNYIFVGKVGNFCPIKPGRGGGELYREKDGKYYAAGGTKGYRWLEAEMVKKLGKEDDIDKDYYRRLVDEAVATISKYGDFEWFALD